MAYLFWGSVALCIIVVIYKVQTWRCYPWEDEDE
jgi:hypothetical protein